MSRTSRVLDDSEDDEEDLVEWHRDILTPSHDAAAKQGTDSTDALKQQIIHAEQDMASTAFATVTTLPASTAKSSLKRSRTELVALTVSGEQNGRLKRVKSSRESLHESSGLLPRAVTQGDIFNIHPQPVTPRFVPDGSIAEGFLAHEPFTMFGQSGSTVPDNTATQQRVRDLAGRRQGSVVRSMVESDDQLHLRSSSVLFSASQLYNTSQATVEAPQETANAADEAVPTQDLLPAVSTPAGAIDPSQASTGSVIEVTAAPSASTTKASKKSPEQEKPAADKLSSSQVALIGLPAEQYKPRPSRRRTTQLPDLPVDYIADPEKVVRIQRSKTAVAIAKSGKTKTTSKKGKENAAIVIVDDESQGAPDAKPSQADETAEITISVGHRSPETSTHQEDERDELAPSQPQVNADAGTEAFIKPARPQTKKKSTKVSKRSHTTIFEDHVDLPVKSQRPSLTQQQADRKAVLADVDKNSGKGTSKRGHRKVIDDDDEDELALPTKSAKSSLPKSKTTPVEVAVTEDDADVSAEEPPIVEPPVVEPLAVESARQDSSPLPPRPSLAPSPEPTPAVSKQAAITTSHKDPPSSSPTHSPLKSGQVPHRVGLSRRHRIPSLLKIVRPLKKT